MGTSDYLPDIYARRPRASADISGKSLVPMLQLSHIYIDNWMCSSSC